MKAAVLMTCQTWGADRQKTYNGHLEGVMCMGDVRPVGPCCMRILPMPTIDLFMLPANMAPHSSYPLAPTCTYLRCISMQPDPATFMIKWGNDADDVNHSLVLSRLTTMLTSSHWTPKPAARPVEQPYLGQSVFI